MTPTLEQLQAVANKLSVDYSADGDNKDTTETLTEKILIAEVAETQLKSMTVDELKVLADVLEMTYVYTNKSDLIDLILAEYTQ